MSKKSIHFPKNTFRKFIFMYNTAFGNANHTQTKKRY